MDEQAKHPVEQIAEACGGKIDSIGLLPDGSGFATMSMPLPKTHWLYQGDRQEAYGTFNTPPMPFRMGAKERITAYLIVPSEEHPGIGVPPGFTFRRNLAIEMSREEFAAKIREAGKYAVRCATMNGKEMDFDPDALIQNLLVGMLGYCTEDGLSSDAWMNPPDQQRA